MPLGLGHSWLNPRGSTDPLPSDLASTVTEGNSREKKAVVFRLPAGLSRSQQVWKSSPYGAGEDGAAGAGL